jgi:hypothetical protein
MTALSYEPYFVPYGQKVIHFPDSRIFTGFISGENKFGSDLSLNKLLAKLLNK